MQARTFFVAFVLLCFARPVAAQRTVYSDISLRVTVIDSLSRQPLDSVNVIVYRFRGHRKKPEQKTINFSQFYELSATEPFRITENSVFEKEGYFPSKIREQYKVKNRVASVNVYMRKKKGGVKLVKPE